jgi:hypothetical protein
VRHGITRIDRIRRASRLKQALVTRDAPKLSKKVGLHKATPQAILETLTFGYAGAAWRAAFHS